MSFIELTSAVWLLSVEVGLKNADGIPQNCERQSFQRLHPGAVRATGEELSRENIVVLKDCLFSHVTHGMSPTPRDDLVTLLPSWNRA
ncbi:MAG TPA: hypothetical protein VGY99_04795 [Candidatus Binataceae bacterium]|nr:hypothetical protein [Candidatus Binataceae bacterium]